MTDRKAGWGMWTFAAFVLAWNAFFLVPVVADIWTTGTIGRVFGRVAAWWGATLFGAPA